MKKIIYSVALLLICALSYSQDNYTVKMHMKVDGPPPEQAAAMEQETVTYIKGDKHKTELTGMMASVVILYDGKINTFLIELMGNKMGYLATKKEMEEAQDKNESKPKIEYTTEKKMIAGYECSKAIVTSLDREKKEVKAFVWVTDKIKSDASKRKGGMGMADLREVKGYPLEVEMSQNMQGMEMKITMTATEVTTTAIPESVFIASTEGYKMYTYKEFKEKMKSMGGF